MTDFPQIKPSVFAGPAVWHMLYCYISKYEPTPQNKKEFKELIFLTLKHFPCDVCSEHALESWKKHNIDNYLQNRDRLFLYVSGILQDGANDNKGIPIVDRPYYYNAKKFIFESMTGVCEKCGN